LPPHETADSRNLLGGLREGLSALVIQHSLRYRSATRYNDGNPLAVIDSEMPNIERQFGLWKPGEPLPTPSVGCIKPPLRHSELWCE
jgi:hypothetical protein